VESVDRLRVPDVTPEVAQTWHTYYLPGFMARVNMWVGNHAAGECRIGSHQPSSIRSRTKLATVEVTDAV
jgi:hypothetical protein